MSFLKKGIDKMELMDKLFSLLTVLCLIFMLINLYYYFLFKNVSDMESARRKRNSIRLILVTIPVFMLVSFLMSISIYLIYLGQIVNIALIIMHFKHIKAYRLAMKQVKTSQDPVHSIQHTKKRMGMISLVLGIIVLIGAFIREASVDSRWNRVFDRGEEQALLIVLFVAAGLLILTGLIFIIQNLSSKNPQIPTNNQNSVTEQISSEGQHTGKSRFCSRCGKQANDETQNFCSSCGEKLLI